MSLGTTLKKLRTEKKESLQEVANAVGASKAHVWELETGKSRNPSLDLLEKIASHFEVTVASLIGEEVSDENRSLMMLNRELKELNDKDIKVIMDLVKSLKNRG